MSGASVSDHLGEPIIVVIGDRMSGSNPGERGLELDAVDPINDVRVAMDMDREPIDVGRYQLSQALATSASGGVSIGVLMQGLQRYDGQADLPALAICMHDLSVCPAQRVRHRYVRPALFIHG
ncbi:hypothetical protein P3W85_44125 [Cupriavidus basilensis]|uniref:Uncharacterized protein n=1 Tax=Cupriavidus basilensis TaxID=68895 RepID=A0ABT6B4S0_9BURK|nr:hypothetical protein [Cupriavidus basilensis]MDF3839875.1 hypothetical protein [Cupriavidus basilensis]